MPRVSLRVERQGRFFTTDPAKQVRRNIREALQELVQYGEAEVKQRIGSIPPRGVQTGTTAAAYTGRVKSLTGKQWEVTAVVSPVYRGPKGRMRVFVQGTRRGRFRIRLANERAVRAISLMAGAAEIEKRHHVVRGVAKAMRAKFKADLTRGLY